MDIMNSLEDKKLEDLRIMFQQHGEEGVPIEVFVQMMMEKLMESEKLPLGMRHESKLVPALCEMFEEIDRNGNGKVEWGEFTGYCVDAGFVATRRFIEPLRQRYQEDIQYKDTTSQGAKVKRLIYLEPIQRIASFENESMIVKLYDPSLQLVSEIDVRLASMEYRKSQTEFRKRDEAVNCYMVPKKNILVIFSSDLSVTFWDPSTLRNLYYGFSKSLQICAGYCSLKNVLYTGGFDSRVQIWIPEQGIRAEYLPTKHEEAITDILVIDEHDVIVTCSLDKTIQLYDRQTHQYRGTINGHKHSVKQLVYSKTQKMLLSVGVEPECYGWDIPSRARVIRFQGHRHALIGLQILPVTALNKTERVITADSQGTFRVWDFQRNHSGQAVCLQVFQRKMRSFNGKQKEKGLSGLLGAHKWSMDDFFPNTFCVTENSGDVIAGAAKMCRFTTSQNTDFSYPNGALFNSVSLSFITISGTDVQIWDGPTGVVKDDMFALAATELTTLMLDDRGRKFIVGTADGLVNVHNYYNGVRMKHVEVPHDADVTGLAYVGREKILISVARDQQLLIHDEWPEDECAPFLRCVKSAHATDITSVAYSDAFSMIATGAMDGSVHLWDFEFLKPMGSVEAHDADISCVEFLGPYPIILTADTSGVLLLSLIHPHTFAGRVLHRWENWNDIKQFGSGYYHSESGKSDKRIGITALTVQQDGNGEYVACIGDELGVIKCLKLTRFIKEAAVEPRKEANFPHTRTGFNARRRMTKDFAFALQKSSSSTSTSNKNNNRRGKNASSTPSSRRSTMMPSSFKLKDLVPVSGLLAETTTIKAHNGMVNSVQIISNPPCILSSSFDQSVRVHSFSGDVLGLLNMSDEDRVAIGNGQKDPSPWKFDIKPAVKSLEQVKKVQAERVMKHLQQMKATSKPKLLENLKNQEEGEGGEEQNQLLQQTPWEEEQDQEGNEFSTSTLMFPSLRNPTHSQLLQQVLVEDGNRSVGKVKAKYDNFVTEKFRHQNSLHKLKRVDSAPSDFLKQELGLKTSQNLRDRQRGKLKRLNTFRRRFASQRGFLASQMLSQMSRDSEGDNRGDNKHDNDDNNNKRKSSSKNNNNQDHIIDENDEDESRRQKEEENEQAVQNQKAIMGTDLSTTSISSTSSRPSTAPLSMFIPIWEQSNQTFLNGISGVLSDFPITPMFNRHEHRNFLTPLRSNGDGTKRPSTAGYPTDEFPMWEGNDEEDSLFIDSDNDEDEVDDDVGEDDLADQNQGMYSLRGQPLAKGKSKRVSSSMASYYSQSKNEDWRRRSTLVLQRYESALEMENDSPREEEHEGLAPLKKTPPSMNNNNNGSTRRRTSLLERQTDFSIQMRQSKIQQTKNLERRRSSIALASSRSRKRLSVAREMAKSFDQEDEGNGLATVSGVRESTYGKRFGPYNETFLRTLYTLFRRFDPDDSGAIDMQEFYQSPEWKGSALASSLGSIFETLDEDGDSMIDFEEFLKCFCPLAQPSDIRNMRKHVDFLRAKSRIEIQKYERDQSLSEEAMREIDALFASLDKNGDEMISLDELSVLCDQGTFIKLEDLRLIVQRYGKNQELDKTEFIELCREYFSYQTDSDEMIREILRTNLRLEGEAGSFRR